MRPLLSACGVLYLALAFLGTSVTAIATEQNGSLSCQASQDRKPDGIHLVIRLTNMSDEPLKIITDGMEPSLPSRGGNLSVIFEYAAGSLEKPGIAILKKGESLEIKSVIDNKNIPHEDSSVALISYVIPPSAGKQYGAWFGRISVRPQPLITDQ